VAVTTTGGENSVNRTDGRALMPNSVTRSLAIELVAFTQQHETPASQHELAVAVLAALDDWRDVSWKDGHLVVDGCHPVIRQPELAREMRATRLDE
jgi:hypothetical protein